MGTDDRLDRIEKRLESLERDVGLAINYMRVLAEIMGCRAKLEEIDRELHDNEQRNGDTQP